MDFVTSSASQDEIRTRQTDIPKGAIAASHEVGNRIAARASDQTV
jgi:hypothetical protein